MITPAPIKQILKRVFPTQVAVECPKCGPLDASVRLDGPLDKDSEKALRAMILRTHRKADHSRKEK